MCTTWPFSTTLFYPWSSKTAQSVETNQRWNSWSPVTLEGQPTHQGDDTRCCPSLRFDYFPESQLEPAGHTAISQGGRSWRELWWVLQTHTNKGSMQQGQPQEHWESWTCRARRDFRGHIKLSFQRKQCLLCNWKTIPSPLAQVPQEATSFLGANQGSPTLLFLFGTGPAAGGERPKPDLDGRPLPVARVTAWAPPAGGSAAAAPSRGSRSPAVNCACASPSPSPHPLRPHPPPGKTGGGPRCKQPPFRSLLHTLPCPWDASLSVQ